MIDSTNVVGTVTEDILQCLSLAEDQQAINGC